MSAPVEIYRGAARTLPARVVDGLRVFRDRVFGEGLRWKEERSGRDEYDACNPVYLVACREGRVVGCLRLMPTEGPCMTHVAFRHLLDEEAACRGPRIWELSRFAATDGGESAEPQRGGGAAAAALFAEALAFARARGVTRFVGVATRPVLGFVSTFGLAPRTARTPDARPGEDDPVAFILDVPGASPHVSSSPSFNNQQSP